jgi:hypothetical protein
LWAQPLSLTRLLGASMVEAFAPVGFTAVAFALQALEGVAWRTAAEPIVERLIVARLIVVPLGAEDIRTVEQRLAQR